MTVWAQKGAAQLVSSFNRASIAAGRFETANERAMRSSTMWATAGIAGGAAIVALGARAANTAGQVERIHTGFQTMLGSASKADALLAQVYKLDKETPFDFLTTANLAQQGLASGFRSDLIPTMRSVAMATVAAGKGSEVYARAMAIISKIKATGVLSQVRLNQFGAAGIPARDILKKQLGLDDSDMVNIGKLKLKADVVIPALVKGFNEEYKGALEKASKTLLGSAEILAGSRDKLLASLGKAILPDVTSGIQGLTRLTDKAQEYAAAHPRIVKAAFYGGGAAAATATIYGTVTALKMATNARKLLERAVKADASAELAKTAIAGKEGAAIAGVGKNALGTAGKLGILARAGNFLRSPLAIGGNAMQGLNAFGGRATLGGLGAQGGAATMGLTTVAGAAASLALGAWAGVQARGNMKAAGYSDGQSAAYGVATGISAGLVAMFVPGGAIAVAAGSALAGLINKLYNEPAEKKAEEGSGPQGEELTKLQNLQKKVAKGGGPKSRQELADYWNQKADEAFEQGDTVTAQSYRLNALTQKKEARKENTPGSPEWIRMRDNYARQQQLRLQPGMMKDIAERQRKRELSGELRPSDTGIVSNAGRQTVTEQRNMNRKVTVTLDVPASRADKREREDRYVASTPYYWPG